MHDNIFDENKEYKIIKYIQSLKKYDIIIDGSIIHNTDPDYKV